MDVPHARPGTDEADRSVDDWHRTQNTAGKQPGAVVLWLVLMAALLGGFALMGASFALGNGVVFAAGLLLSGLAFLVPLGLLGDTER
ncbi:hypothetical protein [Actinotalea fermentans]|uniref:Uncharacterized protein n=1 Tax=Actinotalea fermentans TaxID=43671 RepID=A0A511YV49_9CELL|nr:hypothetical protein [Actinotalea fermentans]KGM16852.1 hypothetical protein N867_14880 [Actinotalea fermentans ATCC 43279 = JCM 9966 = DSM 3133]GEN79063.1 hypothetical protein AFE02nite_07970 [Actinotalea fermentans]